MNTYFGSHKKSVTRTFRIKREWDEVLKEEAERQGVSVSVLLNYLCRKYSLYTRWTDRYNNINISQQAFREILNAASTERLAEAGTKSGATDFINTINAFGFAADYNSFVNVVTELLGGPDYARWFRCFHHKHGNNDIFQLQHDLGYRWSTYIGNYLNSGLESLTGIEVEPLIRDYSVTLEVNLPRIDPIPKTRKSSQIITLGIKR